MMKLRIKGNSLRLRVSRSEVDRLVAGTSLQETIRFAPGPESTLTYRLAVASSDSPINVRYSQQRIEVVLQEDQVQALSQDSHVGIYSSLDIGSGELLELIIEKDFACLDRSDEDNTDTFPNPHAGALC
jgi:hypothetical protein